MSARSLPFAFVLLLVFAACGRAEVTPDALAFSAPTGSSNSAVPKPILLRTTTAAEDASMPEAGPAGCSVERYEVVLPSGWFEHECRRFSSIPLASDGVDGSIEAEIELSFTTSRSYADTIASVEAGEQQIVRQESVRVDGLHARQFVVVEDGYNRDERVLVVVDAGDGVFTASTNVELGRRPPTALSGADWFADVKVEFAGLLRNVTIHEQAGSTCPPLNIATTDLDNAVWTDLDNDGVSELLYRTDRVATGDHFGIRVVDGCALVPVTNGTGVPMSLKATATETREQSFMCYSSEPADEGFSGLTTTRTIRSTADGSALRHEVTSWTYRSGVLTSGATRVISPVTLVEDDEVLVGPESCVFNESGE